jgi:acetoin utilization deacetylase AcuC-like enzyme
MFGLSRFRVVTTRVYPDEYDEKSKEGLCKNNKPLTRKSLILAELTKHFPEAIIDIYDELILPSVLQRTHDPRYIEFLRDAFASWNNTIIKNVVENNNYSSSECDWNENYGLVPHEFYTKLHPKMVLYKQSGYYGRDTMTPIFKDTYRDAMISANLANMAGLLVHLPSDAGKVIYVLTSSPGHHASRSAYGGYCFFNNAFISATSFIATINRSEFCEQGRAAILDIDYHAGNGTARLVQETNRRDIMAVSIHVDPSIDYPGGEGFADEYPDNPNIINIPLMGGTDLDKYLEAVTVACRRIAEFQPQALVIAFGADTYFNDPDACSIGRFKLIFGDYKKIAKRIRNILGLNIPIIVTQEGGYDLKAVPLIVCEFLESLIV